MREIWLKNDLPTLLFLLFFNCCFGQEPVFHHFTADSGLPSNSVYTVFKDTDGFLWFGTSKGFCSYDGYEFRRYKTEREDNFIAMYDFAQDTSDVVYSFSGLAFHYSIERDSILLSKDSKLLRKSLDRRSFLTLGIYFDSLNTKYIFQENLGIFKLEKPGAFELIKGQYDRGFLVLDHPGKMRFIKYSTSNISMGKPPLIKKIELYNGSEIIEIPISIKNVEDKGGRAFWKSTTGDIYATINGAIYQIKNNQVIRQADLPKRVDDIFVASDGWIYFACLESAGLIRAESWDDIFNSKYETYLSGKSVTSVVEDQNGGIWMSTLDDGVFYCPNFDVKIYETESLNIESPPNCLVLKNENELFFGTAQGKIYLLNTATNEVKQLPEIPKSVISYALHYDEQSDVLWCANQLLWYFENGRWKELSVDLKNGKRAHTGVKNLKYRKKDETLWFVGWAGFGAASIREKKIIFNSRDLNLKARSSSVLKKNNDEIIADCVGQVVSIKGDSITKLDNFKDNYKFTVLDFAETKTGKLIAVLNANGIFIENQDSSFSRYKADDGLVSDAPTAIHESGDNEFWIKTHEGISFMKIEADGKPKFTNFKKENGLPTNEISTLKANGNDLWLTSKKGIIRWEISQDTTPTTAPKIIKTSVNNHPKKLDPKNNILRYNENTLTIDSRSLQYQYLGKIPYRYRIQIEDDWTFTENPKVILTSLAPDDYRFEIQTKSQSGNWSESTALAFSICAPWWQTWWFSITSTLFVLGLIFLWYKTRTTQLKKEAALQKEINALERAALNAQMNPHFIFNCLNSIQNFIVKNDRDQAVNYLSKFAKLTRRVLKSSTDGKILLEEEIDFLKNYLSLEQLRFKNKFEFSFNIDKNLNLLDTYLPPLLIQPFVENAVKHGMKGKNEGGKIELFFEEEDESVRIRIRDNGSGISQTEENPKLHTSMGMSITGRRLEIMNSEIPINLKELKNESGKIIGTEVQIFVDKIE